jgi:hypothetical protein
VNSVWLLPLAVLFPFGLLGALFGLAYLEDTLPRDVLRARRRPDPAPILAVPDRSAVTLPVQRAHASDGSRVIEVSLGGSTNR